MGGTISCFEPGESANLLLAAVQGDPERVKEQLESKPLLVLHRGLGGLRDSAWHLAAAYGHVNVISVLYDCVKENKEMCARRLRVKHKHPELTEDDAVDMAVNVLNVKGQTPLMFACFAGKAECAAQLISMGADPWVQDLCGGRTALHYAAMHGYCEVVNVIMKELPPRLHVRTTNINTVRLLDVKTICGFTPLHYAAYNAHPGIVRTLLEHGASATAMTSVEEYFDLVACPQWTTPLHVAALQGNMQACRELLQHYMARRESGTLRDLRLCADRVHRLPFHVARLRNHIQIAELLHPMTNLDAIFDESELEKLGAPKLAIIAARVLQRTLLGLVDSADAKIATLPPLQEEEEELLSPPSRKASGTGLNTLTRVNSKKLRRNSFGRIQPVAGPHTAFLPPDSPAARSRASLRPAGGSDDGMQSMYSRTHTALQGAGSLPLDADWWTPQLPAVGLGASEISAGIQGTQDNALVGAPTPNDQSIARTSEGGLVARLRTLGRRSSRRLTTDGSEAGDTSAAQTPRSSMSLAAGNSASVAHSGFGASPFAAMSWGTTAMVASLPSQTQCTICLDDAYALVEVPCLHRLCVPCSRRLVMAMKDKPLGCPVCRQLVRGFYAPHDATALVKALNMMPM